MSNKLQNKLISLKEADFRYFFKGSKRVSTQVANFYFKKNEKNVARLGIVIKKLHVRTAVKRNKIKRLLREHYRAKLASFTGCDLVVFINKPPKNPPIDFFKIELEKQWSKLESFAQRYLSN